MIQISVEDLSYIVKRLLDHARSTRDACKKNKDDTLEAGRHDGCYEMLDILQCELEAAGVDLQEIGFDVDLLKELF